LERASPELSVVDLHLNSFGDSNSTQDAPKAISPPSPTERIHGKAIVWASESIRITESITTELMNLRSVPLDDCVPKYADIPNAGEIAQGHPVLTVLASGTITTVEQRLREEILKTQEFLRRR
jgi:predicted ATP-grasp superfamily ATP-dependent carboligase